MKVLMSAYACLPGAGSEFGTGWAWACAAAERHEVWLLTRENKRPAIERALAERPDLRIHPVYLDLPSRWTKWKRGQRGVRLYYVLWQRRARRLAIELHTRHRFDVAHHVTFASDWLPAGVVGIDGLPSVWGPVGGAAPFPWPVLRDLGLKGTAFECVRAVSGGVGRRIFGDWAATRAAVVVAQNEGVRQRFAEEKPLVEPHVAIDGSLLLEDSPLEQLGWSNDRKIDLVFVGRLLPWKGAAIAIKALGQLGDRTRHLTIIGTGPDRRRLERLVSRLGLSSRVEFRGHLPRGVVTSLVTSAAIFVHPAVHDSAPWAVAEAIAIGIPIVVLGSGGSSLQVERAGGGAVVPLDGDIATSFAEAIEKAVAPVDRSVVAAERLPDLLDDWYRRARLTVQP